MRLEFQRALERLPFGSKEDQRRGKWRFMIQQCLAFIAIFFFITKIIAFRLVHTKAKRNIVAERWNIFFRSLLHNISSPLHMFKVLRLDHELINFVDFISQRIIKIIFILMDGRNMIDDNNNSHPFIKRSKSFRGNFYLSLANAEQSREGKNHCKAKISARARCSNTFAFAIIVER